MAQTIDLSGELQKDLDLTLLKAIKRQLSAMFWTEKTLLYSCPQEVENHFAINYLHF